MKQATISKVDPDKPIPVQRTRDLRRVVDVCLFASRRLSLPQDVGEQVK